MQAFKLPLLIQTHLRESARIKNETANRCAPEIEVAIALISDSFAAGGKLLLCGNGGSAGDCQHIAAEFTSVLRQDFPRPALPAIALTTDTSFLTARGNDYGFDGIFKRLVEALGRSGDVLMGISTSGNSKNVCAAISEARNRGLITIALTGEDGGEIARVAQVAIKIPSRKVQHIQEAHIAVGHIICQAVEEQLYTKIFAK
jgi:D-sedoheptulose 7-phosphate isomerase